MATVLHFEHSAEMAGSGDSYTVCRARGKRPRSVETRAAHSNGAHSQQFGARSGPGVALAINNLRFVYTRTPRGARSATASIKKGLANAPPAPLAIQILVDAMGDRAPRDAFVYTKRKLLIASATPGPLGAPSC